MPRAAPGLNAFNAGELSPLLDGRVDFDKYQSGCKRLENFIPLVQGPAMRRGGTKYINEVADSDYRSWLLRFMFSATEAYILEFGQNVIRLYTDRGYVTPAAYNGGTTYSEGQFVTSAGVVYRAITTTVGNAPPNATYWNVCSSLVPELPCPYTAADLVGDDGECAVKVAQSGDVLYVVNSNGGYMPLKIERYSDTRWTISRLWTPAASGYGQWLLYDGPFATENDGTNTVHCQVITDQEPGSTVYLSSPYAGFFASTDVNTLFRLAEKSLNDTERWSIATAVVANDVRRSGQANYKALGNGTTGNYPPTHKFGSQYDGDGSVVWQYLDNGEGSAQITAINSTSTKTITGAANNGAGAIRITAVAHGFETGYAITIASVGGTTEANGQWYITKIGADTFDLIGSTFANLYTAGGTATLSAGQVATATVRSRIPDKACGYSNLTTRWSRCAIRTDNAPTNVAFFRERLTFVNARDVYCSVSADFENFASRDELGLVVKDRALTVSVVSGQADATKWVAVLAAGMMIGSSGGEMLLTELTTSEAFGPGNVQVVPHTTFGGRGVSPPVVGGSAFFVQRSGRKIRQSGFSAETGGIATVDMTALHTEILTGGVVDMAWQPEPYQILWVVTALGALVALTYNAEQQVVGWSRHYLGGSFGTGEAVVESVQVMPSPTNDRDDLYLIVKRTIDGATFRSIEVMMPEIVAGDDFDAAYYVDCGLTYDGAATATITGLDHLEGQTVQVLTDGLVHPDCVVSGGEITLDYTASVVHVGLGYDSVLQTMRLEAGAADGTAQGKTKRINRVTLRLNETLGAKFGPSTAALDTILFGNPPTERFSGDKSQAFRGGYDRDGYVVVVQDQPLPMTVVGIYPHVTTQDGG